MKDSIKHMNEFRDQDGLEQNWCLSLSMVTTMRSQGQKPTELAGVESQPCNRRSENHVITWCYRALNIMFPSLTKPLLESN